MPLIHRGPFRPALMMEQQLFMIQPHQVEDRGVQVVYVDAVLDRVDAEIVGLTDDLAPLDPAPGSEAGVNCGPVLWVLGLFKIEPSTGSSQSSMRASAVGSSTCARRCAGTRCPRTAA